MVLTVLYSIAGLGIAIVNDFKSIEGDRCGAVRDRAGGCTTAPQHNGTGGGAP